MTYSSKGDSNELAKPIIGPDITGAFDFYMRDQYTDCIGSIDSAHLKVHQGKSYIAHYRNAAVAIDGTVNVLVVPAAGTFAHVLAEITASGDALVEVFEGVTTSNDGTAITAFNRNRNSANVAGNVITHTPTVTNTGTALPKSDIYGGTKAKALGGTDGFGDEFILIPETKYLVRVTNNSGAEAIININILWYE